jgi:hypothetical protein
MDVITLLGCGDIGPVIKPVDQFVEPILPVLRGADIRFGQCERVYSHRGYYPKFDMGPSGHNSRLDPEMASIFKTAGFDVLSLASNHTMEWGPEPLSDTIALLRKMGIQTVGAGMDGEEARRPAIIEREGVKIAFLAYCSVLRDGQTAGPGRPGIAPVRAHTYYEPWDYQPGAPPKITTLPYDDDVVALQEDIRKAKAQADVVVLSLHWGVRHLPKVIATYQPIVAHAAIDAGTDLILGHHAHILKGIEVYKGKVCFYSLNNFLTTGSLHVGQSPQPQVPEWNLFWRRRDPHTPLYGFQIDSKKTMIAKAVISKAGVERVSFLPVFINEKTQPEGLKPQDEHFSEIVDYMEWVSDGFPHSFRVEGDEVVIETK